MTNQNYSADDKDRIQMRAERLYGMVMNLEAAYGPTFNLQDLTKQLHEVVVAMRLR